MTDELILDFHDRQKALAYLERAIDVVCEKACPSVWQTGEDRPHLALCREARAFIAKEVERSNAARPAPAGSNERNDA